MIVGRLCLVALLAFPSFLFAQKKQIQELQRDMALLQDQIRITNDKLDVLTVLIEQTLERVNKANTAVAVVERTLKDNLKQQEKIVSAPVATLGAKVDKMSDEFRFVRESIADLNSRIGRVQTQITDLGSIMQIMSAPPLPPGEGGLPPTASAETLFNNARRDQSGGKMDLALAQYKDYVKYYPNTDLAPAAQYGIGDIYYTKGEHKLALQAFDLVLEKYPENQKTADAMYMKGLSLAKTGQKRSAARELRALFKKYPNSELAEKAKAELKEMGYSTR
jgi:tol-pal system protein YbgF